MRKTFIYAIMGAVGVTAFAETTPVAFAEGAKAPPTSLEQVRANVRGEAMTALKAGDLQTVGRRRWRGGGRRYGGRRYYGGRGYYGGRRYYGGRGYYGRPYYGRRYYYRRPYYRPGIYFGIGI